MMTLCINGHWSESTENLYGCPHCPQKPTAKTTKRPYAQPNAQRRSIYTDDETWAKLMKLGNGNASAGIREAVRKVEKQS